MKQGFLVLQLFNTREVKALTASLKNVSFAAFFTSLPHLTENIRIWKQICFSFLFLRGMADWWNFLPVLVNAVLKLC